MTEAATSGEEQFVARDGRRLFARWWAPDGAAKATLVIVHGYAEHSGRYQHVAEYLTARGYAVEALDLRGHGRSDGPRASVRSVDEYHDDVTVFLARVRKRRPDSPIFVLGHSMGGSIVVIAVIRDLLDVAGVILSGAGLRAKQETPRVVQQLVRLIAWLFPRLPLRKLAAADVSRDPEVVARYEGDSLVYRGGMPAGTIAALISAGKETARRMEEFSLPVLIMHGMEDALTAPEGSRELYDRASAADKTLKLYDGLYHEILNEPEKEQVLTDLVAWLDGRCGGA